MSPFEAARKLLDAGASSMRLGDQVDLVFQVLPPAYALFLSQFPHAHVCPCLRDLTCIVVRGWCKKRKGWVDGNRYLFYSTLSLSFAH